MAEADQSHRLAAGNYFSIIVGIDGFAYSFGDNLQGQCGHAEGKNEYVYPKRYDHSRFLPLVNILVWQGRGFGGKQDQASFGRKRTCPVSPR